MAYEKVWPLIRAGAYGKATAVPKRTPAEQRAEIERVAREHGVDLSEEGFNKVLRKVGTPAKGY